MYSSRVPRHRPAPPGARAGLAREQRPGYDADPDHGGAGERPAAGDGWAGDGWAGDGRAGAGVRRPPATVAEAAAALSAAAAGGRVGLGEAVAAVAAAADALGSVVVAGEDGEALLDAAVGLTRLDARLAAGRFAVLGEAQTRGAHLEHGATTVGAWLRAQVHLDPAEAHRQVRTGVRLRHLPRLAEALAAGNTTAAHAIAIATAAIPQRLEAIQAVEEVLVDAAGEVPPQVLRRMIKRVRDAVDDDGSDDTEPLDGHGPDERRELDLVRTIDMWVLRGDLDVFTGEKLAVLLDALQTPDPPDTPPEKRRSAAQRRHDALDRMLDLLLAIADQLPHVHGAPAHILAMIDLGELLGDTPLARDADALAAALADPDTTPDQLRALLLPDHHPHGPAGPSDTADQAHPDTSADTTGDHAHGDTTSGDTTGGDTSADQAHGDTSGDAGDQAHPDTSADQAHPDTSADQAHPDTSADQAHRDTDGDHAHGDTTGGDATGDRPGSTGATGDTSGDHAYGDTDRPAPPGDRGAPWPQPRPTPPAPRLRYFGEVPASVVRRLARDAAITAVLTLGPWRVVNVGRAHRTLPAWLRNVMHLLHGHSAPRGALPYSPPSGERLEVTSLGPMANRTSKEDKGQ